MATAIPRRSAVKAPPPPPPPPPPGAGAPPPPPDAIPAPPEPSITLALPKRVTPLANEAGIPGTLIQDAPTMVDPKAPPPPPPPPPVKIGRASVDAGVRVNIQKAPPPPADHSGLSDRTRAEMEHGRSRIQQHVQTVRVADESGKTVELELSPRTIAEMSAGRARVEAHQQRQVEREAEQLAEESDNTSGE